MRHSLSRRGLGEVHDESGNQATHSGGQKRPCRISVPIRLRQSFCFRSSAGRLAGRTKLAAASAARPLCRADLGHVIHDAARGKPPHLDLSHPALCRASALCAHRQRAHPQRAVQRRRRHADAIALEPDSHSKRSDRLHRRHRDARRQWRRGDADRHGDPHLRRQPLDDRPLLLQCRRRNAHRAAAGTRPLRHRARHHRDAAGRDRRYPARTSFPRRAAGRTCRAAISARITASRCGCRNWVRSAPTDSPIRAIS